MTTKQNHDLLAICKRVAVAGGKPESVGDITDTVPMSDQVTVRLDGDVWRITDKRRDPDAESVVVSDVDIRIFTADIIEDQGSE